MNGGCLICFLSSSPSTFGKPWETSQVSFTPATAPKWKNFCADSTSRFCRSKTVERLFLVRPTLPLHVKRERAEIDNAMMILEDLGTKQTYYRRIGRKQPAMDQALQIHDAYFLPPKA